MKLRYYQEEAREAVQAEWEKGNKRTLLVLPTGCGKTIVFSSIIEDRVRQGERVLILAHRGELLEQASDKLKKVTDLNTAVEKAEQTSLDSFFRVVVGSVQTLQGEKRLKKFEPDHFDTIIVDEAHHCISDGYQRVLQYFENANVLGVTATPDRGDMRNLGTYFDSLAYEYTLPKAIKAGYLSPIKALTIPLKLEQMDLDTLNAFGEWLTQEGLQAIATRVSKGGECSIIIEDGTVLNEEAAQPQFKQWKKGEF